MIIKINREMLAWAAGFFDGEGYVKCTQRFHDIGWTWTSTYEVKIEVVQTSTSEKIPDSLIKFQNAVFGLGRVNGPYHNQKDYYKIKYSWIATSFHEVQATIVALYPFLCGYKRNQCIETLKIAKNLQSSIPRRTGTKTHYPCGHPRTQENTYEYPRYGRPDLKPNKTCKICTLKRSK